MPKDLYETVRAKLSARRGDWKAIAADLAPDLSYSFISKVGRGDYPSAPSYARLKRLAAYLAGRAN